MSVIVRYILRVFALFLEQNLVPLTNRCCFEYGLLKADATGTFFVSGCPSSLSVCLGCSCVLYCLWSCFNNLTWFLGSSFSLLVDVCFVLNGTLVDFPRPCYVSPGCSNSSFIKRIGDSSWMFVLLDILKWWTFWSMMLLFRWYSLKFA